MVNNINGKAKVVRDQISKLTPPAFLQANISIGLLAATFERLTDRRLKRYGLNHSGFMILYLIVENGGSMNVTDITKKLYLTRQSVSVTTRYLEEEGFISRNGIKDDRRKIRVEITEKGLDIIKDIGTSDDRREIHNVLALVLNEEEAKQLASTLKSIAVKLHRLKYI